MGNSRGGNGWAAYATKRPAGQEQFGHMGSKRMRPEGVLTPEMKLKSQVLRLEVVLDLESQRCRSMQGIVPAWNVEISKRLKRNWSSPQGITYSVATSAFYNISPGRPPFPWSTFTSICWESHQNLATELRSYYICNISTRALTCQIN